MDTLLLRVPEAARLLGIGRSKAYELAAAGILPTVRIGASIRIPAERLRAWVAEQATSPDGEAGGPQDPRAS